MVKRTSILDESVQTTATDNTNVKVLSYDDAKNRRILRQGAIQHALVSPAIAGMQYTNLEEFLVLVRQAAEYAIAFVEEK